MKKSFINISSGALGFALPMMLNLFFTPLIVKNLDSAAYGLQSLVNVIIGFLMIADMGLDIPVTRSVAEFKAKNDSSKLNNLLNSTLSIYLLIGTFGLLCIGLSAPILADHVFKIPDGFRDQAIKVFYLAGIGFVGGLFSIWGKSIFNGFLRYDISNSISVIGNLLSLLIGTFLVVKGFGVVAYVFVRVLFTFLTGFSYLLISKMLLKDFRISLKINKEVWFSLKKQIGYGFLLRLSGILTSRLDQTLIGISIGVAAVGFYSIPVLIITSIGGLINSMTHYLFPQMSELNSLGKQEEIKSLFLQASRYVGMLTFFVYTPFIVFGEKFLHFWVGAKISDNASTVFVLLLVSAILSSIFALLTNHYLVAVGKLDLFTKYILFRSIFLALTMVVFLKYFGLNGVGVSMIIGGMLDALFYFFIVKKYVRLNPFPLFSGIYLKLFIVSFSAGVFVTFFYLKNVTNMTTLFVGSIIYTVVFLLLCILLKVFNKEEITLFRSFKTRISTFNK